MVINRNTINLIKRNDIKFKNIKFMQDEKLKKEFFTSFKKLLYFINEYKINIG